MTDNVKVLNLYTADDANGWINDADEAITTGAKNGLKIEDNGETTDLGTGSALTSTTPVGVPCWIS